MTIEVLKAKSDENNKTAEWAEEMKFFDAAVSRYYYSAYQKLIYISKKKGVYEDFSQRN